MIYDHYKKLAYLGECIGKPQITHETTTEK